MTTSTKPPRAALHGDWRYRISNLLAEGLCAVPDMPQPPAGVPAKLFAEANDVTAAIQTQIEGALEFCQGAGIIEATATLRSLLREFIRELRQLDTKPRAPRQRDKLKAEIRKRCAGELALMVALARYVRYDYIKGNPTWRNKLAELSIMEREFHGLLTGLAIGYAGLTERATTAHKGMGKSIESEVWRLFQEGNYPSKSEAAWDIAERISRSPEHVRKLLRESKA